MQHKPAAGLIVLAMSLQCFLLHAQDDYSKHQIFAGYGFGFTNQVFTQMGDAFGIDFIQSMFPDSSDESSVMPLYVGYRYFLKKHFSAGFNLAFPTITAESQQAAQTVQSKTAAKQQFHSIIFLPRVDVHYVNKKAFNLYSGIGAGIMLQNNDEMNTQQPNIAPAYQITAIGFFIGKMFGVFTEIGYGVNGILSFGIATDFGGEESLKAKSSEAKFAKRKTFAQPCIRL